MSIEIGGVYMDRSLKDFVRACEARIEAEQAKPLPETALIALLCDAVRLSRELTRWMGYAMEMAPVPEETS